MNDKRGWGRISSRFFFLEDHTEVGRQKISPFPSFLHGEIFCPRAFPWRNFVASWVYGGALVEEITAMSADHYFAPERVALTLSNAGREGRNKVRRAICKAE